MVDRLPTQVVEDRLGLTAREAEVAILLARGASNAEVADRLHISPHTARHHVARILKKLNVSIRSSVALALLRSQNHRPGL
jgi:DNA-binding CsgD family transcriptional regulator